MIIRATVVGKVKDATLESDPTRGSVAAVAEFSTGWSPGARNAPHLCACRVTSTSFVDCVLFATDQMAM